MSVVNYEDRGDTELLLLFHSRVGTYTNGRSVFCG